MSGANRTRGDREIDLGDLGVIVFRPSFRAMEAIEAGCGDDALFLLSERLEKLRRFRLRDAVLILYETHLDGENAKTFSREEIGEAIRLKGMNHVWGICWDLVTSAFDFPKAVEKPRKDEPKAAETDEGNA